MKKLYSKFESLTEEKRKKIIEICIGEFSQHGYKNASTNNIVKNAEISKGILFHYFGSKKSLYLYVLDYAFSFLREEMFKKMVDLPADFFERLMKLSLLKLKMVSEYPDIYKFVLEAVTNTDKDVADEVQKRYAIIYKENVANLYADIDTSKFRGDIDRGKALEIISLALEGLSNKYVADFRNMPVENIMTELEGVTKEFWGYIEVLKYGVYEKP